MSTVKTDDPYFNPRVKVRDVTRTVNGRFHTENHDYKIERQWAVYQDGERTDLRIVRGQSGLTMIDGTGRMVECWHIGVSAGDLARLIMKRRAAE